MVRYREPGFTVPAGKKVKVVLENTASSPTKRHPMKHNVVVLNKPPRRELFWRVGWGGVKAGAANEYVPDDPAVLAHTPLSKPGETVSVTFTAPEEPGRYGYVCTVPGPGHWATMNGTIYVEE